MAITVVESPAERAGTGALLLFSMGVLVFCTMRRTQNIKSWSSLSPARWLLLSVYADSILFVFSCGILKSWDLDAYTQVCDAAILICLSFYFSSKIMLWTFFVERIRIVRNPWIPRRQDKLYLFNVIAAIGPYTSLVIVNYVYRIDYLTRDGRCIIGMQRKALIPMSVIEASVNVWLTSLFILPLRNLLSYQQNMNPEIRNLAKRNFIACLLAMLTSGTNAIVTIVLDGERGYRCLMACNLDVLLNVLILYWVSSREGPADNSSPRQTGNPKRQSLSHSKQSGLRNSCQHPDFVELGSRAVIVTQCTTVTEENIGHGSFDACCSVGDDKSMVASEEMVDFKPKD